MRVTVMSVLLWALLIAVRIDARPQEHGTTNASQADMTKEEVASDAWNNSTTTIITPTTSTKPKNVGSRVEPSNAERDLKGYQYMDNSLRKVATQLLNVSSEEEQLNVKDNTMLDKVESRLGLLIRKPDNPIRDIPSNRDYFNDNIKSDMVPITSVDVGFDRSTNSKYNYFKTSHPGEAMALTEEDLERELALSKLMTTTHKKKPTTTGGISTWILLNPPSTTVKPLMSNRTKDTANKRENEKKTTLNLIKPTISTINNETDYRANFSTAAIHKSSPTRIPPTKNVNTVKQSPTMLKLEELSVQTNSYTTPRIETTQNNVHSTLKSSTPRNDNEDSTTMKTTTKRIVSSNRTVRPAVTTPKTTTVISQTTTIKVARPGNSNQSTKSNVIRKATSKPETTKNSVNATSKIEKVTFRPVQMITTPKNTIQQSMPMFITKLQASLHTNSESIVPYSSTTHNDSTPIKEDTPKMNVTFTKRVQTTLKQKPSKPNNVLNVQLKKPVDTQTKIEIQPIKVNTPVLTIEKVEESKKDIEFDVDKPIEKGDSKIDVKFVFNPELTKIVETSAENSVAATTASTSDTSTTTKRPKQKRKKNKTRRRKPSSSTTPSPITTPSITTLITDTNNIDASSHVADSGVAETSLQESKIVPDSESSLNNTKNKKKEVDKPISTQIYSFLSREVMPSFGVMSLVGLGLGLASYFLYPFGGTIARRNYEIQPNYQYNLEEYGGNYGQSEEEVFSKVLQGMTTSDGKYGGMKDYENNYYRYQAYDGAYTDPSYPKRRGDIRYPTSSMPVYRPNNTPLPYNSKYRKNEFQYPDMSTTPKHHERHTESEFMNNHGNDDRQFVVGNVPKGYSYDKESPAKLSTTTEGIQTDFEKQIAQSLKFVENPVNIPPTYEQPEAQALKANEGYDEIEIGPTAVAVEHGPRSLQIEKLEDSVQNTSQDENAVKIRRKRESFIQQIPTRSEMERMEDGEDLSNEILDIIDSAMDETPGRAQQKVEDDKAQSGVENKPIIIPIKPRPSAPADDGTELGASIPTAALSTTTKKIPTTITIKSTTLATKPSMTDESIVATQDFSQSSTMQSSPAPSTDFIIEAKESEGAIDSEATSMPVDTVTASSSTTTTTSTTSTKAPTPERFNFVNFVKKIAEIKFRVGLTVLKHASESFAKYIGNFQKKLNGEE